MGRETTIEWTDHTWNPWRGCQHATLSDGTPHPGCLNCYAETWSRRNPKVLGEWGPDGSRIAAAPQTFNAPLAWNRAAEKAGERRRVFVDSLSDFFEDWPGEVRHHEGRRLLTASNLREHSVRVTNPLTEGSGIYAPERNGPMLDDERPTTLDDLRAAAFRVIDACPWLDFLILTKRPGNIRRFWPHRDKYGPDHEGLAPRFCWDRRNVWLLYSASDQASFDAGVPELLKCRDLSPVLGVSAEPLIGPIDARTLIGPHCSCYSCPPQPCDEYLRTGRCPRTPSRLNWVIVGGESGGGSRPFDLQWARSLIAQCKAAGVPCFLKQIGRRPVDGKYSPPSPLISLSDAKGGDPAEWPNDLPRVRQFPEVAHV